MKVNRIEEQKRTISHIINNYKYGDTISDTILSKLLGYNIKYGKEYNRYIGMMIRIRRHLLEYGLVIKRVSNGYYILKPAQVSRYCYRRNITHAHNIIKCGINMLINLDETTLNNIQLEELLNLKNLSMQLDNEMEDIIKSSQYYSRKAYYDSYATLNKDTI